MGPPKMDGTRCRVLTKRGPLEKGMASNLSILALRTPSMNSTKKRKDRTLKEELPRLVGTQHAMGEQWRNNPRKNEVQFISVHCSVVSDSETHEL